MVSAIFAGAAGKYIGLVREHVDSLGIDLDVTLRPGQMVRVTTLPNANKPDWGTGSITVQGGSSYQATGIRLSTSLTIGSGVSTLSFDRCELILPHEIVVPYDAMVSLDFRQTTLDVPITAITFSSLLVGILVEGNLEMSSTALHMGGNLNVGVAVAAGGSFASRAFDMQMDVNHAMYAVYDEARQQYLPPLIDEIAYSSDQLIDILPAIATLQGHSNSVHSVSFDPSGDRLASGSVDNSVKIWDVSTGECVATLQGHSSAVESVSFDPSGGRLASGSSDNSVKIWDVSTGECVATLQGHSRSVLSVSFDPSGGRLASGSSDNSVKVWFM